VLLAANLLTATWHNSPLYGISTCTDCLFIFCCSWLVIDIRSRVCVCVLVGRHDTLPFSFLQQLHRQLSQPKQYRKPTNLSKSSKLSTLLDVLKVFFDSFLHLWLYDIILTFFSCFSSEILTFSLVSSFLFNLCT
jgi:hypothetical protein